MLHPSGSESLVGDKRRKEDKKVARIYFANKINVKNAPKYVIKVHFILWFQKFFVPLHQIKTRR
jgi:hypothetical protein